MKIVVVGPGAMGCLFAGLLAEAGQEDVWLLDKHERRASEIARNGLKIEGIGGTRLIKGIKATADPKEIGVADLVLICVKSYDTSEASHSILPSVKDGTIVLTLQNGLTNIEVISQILGEDKVVAGITSHGATMLGTGHIRHAGIGDTVVGEPRGMGDCPHSGLSRIESVANILRSAGFRTVLSHNIYDSIWSKLIINAAINPLTAITRLRNGELLEYEETRKLLHMTAEEAARVASARHVALPYYETGDLRHETGGVGLSAEVSGLGSQVSSLRLEDIISSVEAVCKATASNISSMLQDILRGKRTEIDAINGAIAGEAKKMGLEAPVNETLTCLIKVIEIKGEPVCSPDTEVRNTGILQQNSDRG